MKEKPVLHLMVTDKCHLNCPLCCNKGYTFSEIPVVTVEELKSIDTVCITGGEPLMFKEQVIDEINAIRSQYSNIERIYLYTTGQLIDDVILRKVDGLSIGPKTFNDWKKIEQLIMNGTFKDNNYLYHKSTDNKNGSFVYHSHRLYVFPEWEAAFKCIYERYYQLFANFEIFHRKWQTEFKPASNSFFRRLPIFFR